LADYIEYTTRQGDTWDIIALLLYNDEFQASNLMQTNPSYINTVIFPAGVTIKAPVISALSQSTLPPWKR